MTPAAKPQDGDLIDLRYDGAPDAFFVHGHVADDAANAALPDDSYVTGPWFHKWARWSMEATDDGPGLVIRTCDEPGRGRFRVTVCDVLSRKVAP